jgi:hypothetical protein
MSARAMASQKAKRANGSSEPLPKPPVIEQQLNNFNNDTKRISMAEALNILDKKILKLQEAIKSPQLPTPDLLIEFARHLNELEDKVSKISTSVEKHITETNNKMKELNDKLTMNNNNWLIHKKEFTNLSKQVEQQQVKNNSVDELQTLVNTLSTKILINNTENK